MIKVILRNVINIFVWLLGKISNFFVVNIGLHKQKRLLIIRIDGIGDIVLFEPALKYIKTLYKSYEIVILVRSNYESLLSNHPKINKVISLNYQKYKRNIFYKLFFLIKIANEKFEIILYPTYSRERIGDEIVLWSNASEKIGWNTQSLSMTPKENNRGNKIYTNLIKSNFSIYEHELKRNKEFLAHLGIEVRDFSPINYYGEKEEAKIEQLIEKFGINKNQIIVIIPGALKQYRQWAAFNWKNLMSEIIKITESPKFLIVGSKNDENIIQIDDKQFLNNYIINLCGKLALNELPPLFKKSTFVIGNETGPMHIAIASGVKTIAILGGGHFSCFMPYGNKVKNKFIYKKMDCFQCDWQCIYPEKRCVTEITTKEVFDEVKKLLISKNHYIDKDKISIK